MIEFVARITAKPGEAEQIIAALRGVKFAVERDTSGAAAHVAADAEDSETVWYCEYWPSTAAFERHLASERFTQLLSIVETAAKEPLLECRLISETRGLEYIAAVREQERRRDASGRGSI